MDKISHGAQGNGGQKCHVKWRDPIVLRRCLAIFEKEGYRTESQRPLADDEYISLTNGEQWTVASWRPTYESADSLGDSATDTATSSRKESQTETKPTEIGPCKEDADLTDDRQIQGNWIDSSHRCAHPDLQEPHLRDLIKLIPLTKVNPDKDVQPTGQCEI